MEAVMQVIQRIASGMRRTTLVPALALVPILSAPGPSWAAHEIPASVLVQALVKPEGGRLRLLVRVPLAAMRDVEFPVHGPGYLDLPALGPALREAATLWIAQYVTFYEQGQPLAIPQVVAVRVSVPSDPAFRSYDAALAHVLGEPLPEGLELVRENALLDVLLEVPVASEQSRFSIDPEWAHLGIRTSTVLRFLPPGSPERAFQYTDNPGRVHLDPRWHQAALSFVRLGFFHILEGIDHLLFVLCLVIPFRRFLPLVAIVTSFTVAHSITLGASALGFAPDALWFPPFIEVLIALSIVYMAFENIVGARLQRRWMMAFGFGLVHGFGFSFLLRESLQFAGSHLTLSLLAFNVGVELGQVLVVAVAVPALAALFRYGVAERMGTILLSALVAHTAWHWTAERGAELMLYDLQWPAMDLFFLASLMRWLMAMLIVVGGLWALSGVVGRLTRRATEPEAQQGAAMGAGADAA